MNPQHYRPDIDGLRAIAVGSVLIFHAFPEYLPGGFVGVDVFFVISGFLITSIIAKDLERDRFSFVTFYAKRARRIFPALAIVLLAVLVAGWFLLLPKEFERLGWHAAGGAGFVANLVLLSEAGYFDGSAQFKPLLHLWSLGVEEQFYFVWPVILVTMAAIRRPLLWAALAVLVASFLYSLHITAANAHAAFYLPHSRFWELMGGAILALMGNRQLPRPWAHIASGAGLALVVAGMLIVREVHAFPAPMALLPVLGAVLLIAAGSQAIVNKFILSRRLMVGIGLISYPLYLWHWPLLSFPAIINGGDIAPSLRWAALALAVILSVATYYVLETPFREKLRLRHAAPLATGALASTLVAGLFTSANAGLPERPVVQHLVQVEKDFSGPMWEFTKNESCTSRYAPPNVEAYGWWFCMMSDEGDPTVLLLGDSFANHYYAGVVAHPEFASDVVLSIGACEPSPMYEHEVVSDDPQVFSPCTSRRRYDQQLLINDIIAEGTLRLVIMAGITPDPSEDYIRRINERITFIESHGAQVIMILPHLRSDYFTKACFARPLQPTPQTCVEPATKAATLRQGVRPLVDSVSASHPAVRFFDPNTLYCSVDECSFMVEGRPLFRDEYDHLSNLGSRLMVEQLVKTTLH